MALKKKVLLKIVGGSLACAIVSILLSLVTVYVILGHVTFSQLFFADTQTNICYRRANTNTPSNFTAFDIRCPDFAHVELNDLFVKNWTSVTFKSRDPNWRGTLAGYVLEQQNQDAPFVIAVHGWRSCMKSVLILEAAGALYKAGYQVLTLDLRNHGASDTDTANPYATFGSVEYLDVLGGLDFIERRYPNAKHSFVYGVSMGGATALVALAKEAKLRAAFVDAPACVVRDTLVSNLNRETGNWGNFLMSAACAIWPSLSIYGCPPFANDPLALSGTLGPSKSVFFQHATNDLIVPLFNSEMCGSAAMASGANVTHYYASVNITQGNYVRGQCDAHCQLILQDKQGFITRLVTFFNSFYGPPF